MSTHLRSLSSYCARSITCNILIRICVLSSICFSSQAIAVERDLIVEPFTTGPYPVASSNFTISEALEEQLLSQPTDAGLLQSGAIIDGQVRYISELLAFPDDAFNFQLLVPNDAELYGESAGSILPYSGYIVYPTTAENTRPDYDVLAPPSLPHMQREDELPIFADANEKYPLIVFSHGQGTHPTSGNLEYMLDLASHGYIVLGLYHGDSRFDELEARQFNLRPLALKVAIDEILADPAFASHIDSDKIGGVGGSLGGTTMLALLGARKLNPDYASVATNNLLQPVADSRIKAAAAHVPYAGFELYTLFGSGSTGTSTVDRPFLTNSGVLDSVGDHSKLVDAMNNIPGVKYLVEYAEEGHEFSAGAESDARTWSKTFLDAFIKQDPDAITLLSRMKSVSADGLDSLVLVTEPSSGEIVPEPEPEPEPSTLNAVSATFAGTQLTIPGVSVDGAYFDIVLDLRTAEEPYEFLIFSAGAATNSGTAGSFNGAAIIVPDLSYNGGSLALTLTITGENPFVFTLTNAVQNQ